MAATPLHYEGAPGFAAVWLGPFFAPLIEIPLSDLCRLFSIAWLRLNRTEPLTLSVDLPLGFAVAARYT